MSLEHDLLRVQMRIYLQVKREIEEEDKRIAQKKTNKSKSNPKKKNSPTPKVG